MPALSLPSIASEDDYLVVTKDPDRRRAIAEALAARHGFALEAVRAFVGALCSSSTPAVGR